MSERRRSPDLLQEQSEKLEDAIADLLEASARISAAIESYERRCARVNLFKCARAYGRRIAILARSPS